MIKIITETGGSNVLTVEPDGTTIAVKTPRYEAGFVDGLKRLIDRSHRRYEPVTKIWYVAPPGHAALPGLVEQYFGQKYQIANSTEAPPASGQITASFKMWYLGLAKAREFAGKTGLYSLGHTAIELNSELVFPLEVLQKWFSVEHEQGAKALNYFQALGLPRPWETLDDKAVKHAYRLAAKTYHPDINREPGAGARFVAIKEAYDVLAEAQGRKRYLFGLAVTEPRASKIKAAVKDLNNDCWLPPLRCGQVMVKGYRVMGQFQVAEIIRWADLIYCGRPIVTYWNSTQKCVDFSNLENVLILVI